MEDLYTQQLEISEAIRKIPINVKKDSADRKSDDYFKRRLELLERYWSDFQNNHLALCQYGVKDHPYFVNSEHENASKLYTAAKSLINEQRLQLSGQLTPMKSVRGIHLIQEQREEQESAKAGPSGYEQTAKTSMLRTVESKGSTSKLDDMLRKQAANFKAFKRSSGLIDLDSMSEKWEMEDALKTLQARWSQIDALHWEIDSELSGEDRVYEELYTQHERSYLQLKKMINKNLWSVSHREHTTPKMDIPVFSGNYQHWTSFKDLFTEAIHNNPALSQAQKMQFLKGKVRGEAEKLIQHLPISSDNYHTCWEILNHRYNNKKLIFTCVINTLLSLPNTQHQSLGNIKKLHDVALESIHAIQNLGIDISTWDPLLVHLLAQKLDNETYADYIDSLKNSRELPVLQDFLDYLESKFTCLETTRRKLDQVTPKSVNHMNNDVPENQKQKRHNFTFANKYKRTPPNSKVLHVSTTKCQFCGQQHAMFNCERFLQLPDEAKLKSVTKLKLCRNCLFDHKGQQCTSVRRCRKCNANHHSVLHDACLKMSSSNNVATTSTDPNAINNVAMTAHVPQNNLGTNEVLLATALVKVASGNGSYHILRALIDPGSQVSLIKESTAKKLGLRKSKFNGLVCGVGEVEQNCKGMVTLNCSSTHNDFSFITDVLIMKNVLKDIPHKSFDTPKWSYIDSLKLADPYFNISRPVDLLLSAQVIGLILMGGLIKGENASQPVLQETQLGWIIYGGGQIASLQCNVVMNNVQDIQHFWDIEDITEKSNLSLEDQECADFYSSTTKRREDGRYIVKLPLKAKINEKIGSSKELAIAQFQNLERKFSKQPLLAEQYKNFISEYVALGHMVPSYNNNCKQALSCYLPHHSVQRAESATTKLRVVFNASARMSSGYSINDLMYKGPNLQQDLQELILKWRQYRYAYTADIEKMYRQIMVDEADQQYQQIIWRFEPSQPLQTYKLTTVTYGTKSAPFLAMMTLKRLAMDEQSTYPEAAKILEESFYMDDLVHGSHSITKGKQLIKDLNRLLKSGGFTLRKWSANHPELLENIKQNSSNSEIIFNFKSESTAKTLGLRWNSCDDMFTFKYNMANSKAKITKRLLLSEISKVFDPLGWLSPLTTKLKLIFQRLWENKMHWDEEVPENIQNEWLAIKTDMECLNQCKVPRWIRYQPNNVIELHGYCDASTKAYAAVIYARIHKNEEYSVVLVAAKTRLVPVSKSVSLPRLELCGAYLLAKLMNKVSNCYSKMEIRMYGWTDSMVVLSWLQGDHSRWKPFVANRTKVITATMKSSCWRYVKSEDNPADAASRGISASQLKNKSLWWEGPQSLKTFNEKLVTQPITYNTNQELKIKSTVSKVNTVQNNNAAESIILQLLHKFSSLNKIIKIVAWILRAMKTIQVKQSITALDKPTLPEYLTLHELRAAKLLILKYVQRIEFADEIISLRRHKLNNKSKLLKLNPFLDHEGILRVGGRLSKADMNMDIKHPAILPYNSRFTTLAIQQAHQLTFHGGPRLTLFNLRQRYWIISGNKAVKKELRNCVTCKKHEPKLQQQLMGQLPLARSNPAPPFYHSGVDYTGFVDVKSNKGRGIKTTKGYIALFICLATKAIHLELVSDLTSSGFLAALRRMAARRGAPRHLYSDNGTNFVGANRMLQESYFNIENICDRNLFSELTDLNIEWHFNAPSWPSAGGLWERAVRSVKYHLRRVIGEQKLTFEEFSTILAQVEACLNSRPLCTLSEDIDDLNVLTPAHFLTGRSGTTIIETETDARTRWHLSNKIVNDLWKKWKLEYLTQLSIRSKWRNTEPNININDLVTIQDENLPPGKWMMGRVVQTHPGQDGLVRVVTLKTQNGMIKRPVVKLSILPIPHDSSNRHENDGPELNCNLRKPEERKGCNKIKSKFVSLVMSLIFFMSLISSSHAAFNISALPNNNSLYFETVGNMQVIRDRWNLVVYYDMSPYWEANKAATKFLDYLQRCCSSLNDTTPCNMITLQLTHDYNEIKHYNQLMINQHFDARSRQRRGLIDGIGYVANSLFGVLDERFAEQYRKDIHLVKQNENHLNNLLKNQTTIIEAEYNVLKRTEETIQLQHKNINKHLNQLDTATLVMKHELEGLVEAQNFAFSALTTINLLQNLKRIQDTLIDIVTDIYHGKFNTHLLSPDQLQRELQFISGQLTQDTTLPVDNLQTDLKHMYSMLKVKARLLQEYFIFEITFPLTSRDSYKIYKIIPVPQLVQYDMMSVLPAADFVAINLKKDAFFTMSLNELQLCLHNGLSYLCKANKPINRLSIDEKFCKLDKNLKQCIVTRSPCQDRWLELNEPARFMYFCCNTYAVRIICQDQVSFKQITGVGIIDLGPKCIIKSNDFTLYSHALLANSIKLESDVVTPQVAELNHIVNISLSHYTVYDDPVNSTLVDLGKQIKQLKSDNTNSLDYTLSTHDIHLYTISYCLLGAAILVAVYFIWKRCQAVTAVELPQSVANSVVFSRKQSTVDRQPSEVNITSASIDCNRDISTSPVPRRCRFKLDDDIV